MGSGFEAMKSTPQGNWCAVSTYSVVCHPHNLPVPTRSCRRTGGASRALAPRRPATLGAPDQVMIDLIVELAPLVGYPLAAQALTSVAFSPSADHGASGAAIDLSRRAAIEVRSFGRGPDDALADIVGEYGTLARGV